MRQKIMLFVTVSVVSVALGSGSLLAQSERSNDGDHKHTFARFDQAYIPALALTNQQKDAPSKAALRQLTRRWKQVRPSLARAIDTDPKWQEQLKMIDEAISKSARQVQEGQFSEAHETLEFIRDLLMEARRRQSISYPLDSLSGFHTIMEQIVKPAMKYTPESIMRDEIKRLDALCRLADEKWQVAEATDFDMKLFGLDPSAAAPLRKFIEEERRAIRGLQVALRKDDKQKLIKAARGLKPPFAKAYVFFGDFPQPMGSDGNQTTDAIRK